MCKLAFPTLCEIVAVWHMAFGEPPIVTAEAGMLLDVLKRFFPDVYRLLIEG